MGGYLQCHIVYENMQMSKYIYLCIVSWLGIKNLIRPINQISCLFPCNSALQLISLVINKFHTYFPTVCSHLGLNVACDLYQ